MKQKNELNFYLKENKKRSLLMLLLSTIFAVSFLMVLWLPVSSTIFFGISEVPSKITKGYYFLSGFLILGIFFLSFLSGVKNDRKLEKIYNKETFHMNSFWWIVIPVLMTFSFLAGFGRFLVTHQTFSVLIVLLGFFIVEIIFVSYMAVLYFDSE